MSQVGMNKSNSRLPMFESLRVIRKNLLVLLGVFIVSHIPVYLITFLVDLSGWNNPNNLMAETGSGIIPILVNFCLLLLMGLAYAYSIICFATLSEKDRLGEKPLLRNTLHYGFSRLGRVIVVWAPLLAAGLLLVGLSAYVSSRYILLGIVFLPPIFMLFIFQLFVINTVSLRGFVGWKAYRISWFIGRNNWWNLGITILFIAIIISIVSFLFTFLTTRTLGLTFLPNGLAIDLLLTWLFIAVTLHYLDLEKTNSSPLFAKPQ
jgi:hypothetical protein